MCSKPNHFRCLFVIFTILSLSAGCHKKKSSSPGLPAPTSASIPEDWNVHGDYPNSTLKAKELAP